MQDFMGFEPEVGEIRALRTFRVGPDGLLFPLFSDRAWSDVQNTARCAVPLAAGEMAAHSPPAPDCTCGFYGYGTETAALDYPQSRHVLAVVACWGKIITGTRGIRAEHAWLEALWMSTTVPAELAGAVATRYPSTKMYVDKEQMLSRHPITVLDSYEVEPAPLTHRRTVASTLAIGSAVVLSLPPADWLGGTGAAVILAVSFGLLLLAAILTGAARKQVAAARQWVLIVAATIWFVAPIAGLGGWLFIRIPLIELAALIALQRHFNNRESRRFPTRVGHGRSPGRSLPGNDGGAEKNS